MFPMVMVFARMIPTKEREREREMIPTKSRTRDEIPQKAKSEITVMQIAVDYKSVLPTYLVPYLPFRFPLCSFHHCIHKV